MDPEKLLENERRKLRRESQACAVIEQYAAKIDDESSIHYDAEKLLEQGGSLAPYCVLIPVAAHQEPHMVYAALEQYARQTTTEPFSVVLSLNYPAGVDSRLVSETVKEVERAKLDFPHLDVRTTGPTCYFDPTIGEIRCDLWDSVLVAGLSGGTIRPDQDMIGLNHDIDLIKLPRDYIETMQAFFKTRQYIASIVNQGIGLDENTAIIGTPRFTNVKHAYDPDHPNISLAVFWEDLLTKIRGGSYEAGTAVPFSWYAKQGGINPEDTESEVLNMIDNGRARVTKIKSSALETSSRRHVERLQTRTLSEIWGEGSFHATEDYRDATTLVDDISRERMLELIWQSAEADLATFSDIAGNMFLNKKHQDRNIFEAQQRVRLGESSADDEEILIETFEKGRDQALRLTRFVLERIIRHPDTDEILKTANREVIKN